MVKFSISKRIFLWKFTHVQIQKSAPVTTHQKSIDEEIIPLHFMNTSLLQYILSYIVNKMLFEILYLFENNFKAKA